MPRRVGLLALSLAFLLSLPPAARAVDCTKILGNQVSPCGFESAAQVGAWTGSGSAVFAAGQGQNGGAVEGAAEDFGAAGFIWSRRSPCFPVSVGEELSLGYAARLLSRSPIGCSAGWDFWADAACTVGNGGGVPIAVHTLVETGTYTAVLDSQTVPPGSAAMSMTMHCRGDYEFQVRVDDAFAAPVASEACHRNQETACLHAGRFEVQVDWQTQDDSGGARVMEFGGQRTENDESAFWWFFSPTNFEMGVKLLEACVPFLGDKYWVFVSGLTDQGWTVRVRDTYTDATRTYVNPVGRLSETFADTAAFDCP